LRPFYIDVTN